MLPCLIRLVYCANYLLSKGVIIRYYVPVLMHACVHARILLLDDKSTTKDNRRFFDVVMFVTVHETILSHGSMRI